MDSVSSHWSKKTFEPGQVADWGSVQNKFEAHFMSVMPLLDPVANRRAMMLLIVSEHGGKETLFMALPEGQAMYEGFESAQFSEIPPNPSLLVGDQIGYDELFKKRSA